MSKLKGGFLLILCSCLLFTFTSCWDKSELQDMNIVLGVCVDLQPGEDPSAESLVYLNVDLAYIAKNENSGEEGMEQKGTFYAYGRTVAEAVARFNDKMDREVLWDHTQVIIFTDRAAKRGINKYLSYFARSHEFSPLINLFYTELPGDEVFASQAGMSKFSSFGLRGIMRGQNENMAGDVIVNTLKQYLEEALVPQAYSLLPVLKKQAGSENSGSGEEKQPGALFIEGAAMLDSNGVFQRLLDRESVLMANLFFDLKHHFIIIDDDKNSIEISKWRMDKKWIKDKAGNLRLKLTCRAQGRLLEDRDLLYRQGNIDPKELEDNCSKKLQSYVEQSINQVLTDGRDHLFLGDSLRRRQHQDWDRLKDNWPAALDDIDILVEVKSEIPVYGRDRSTDEKSSEERSHAQGS